MIDPKRSKFKRITHKYNSDSLFDIIDVDEAIKKNKPIYPCKDNFIFINSTSRENKPPLVNLDELFFEFDNGNVKHFTEYYKVIDTIGQGGFGLVLSAYDICDKNNVVAIKVSILFNRSSLNTSSRILTIFSKER